MTKKEREENWERIKRENMNNDGLWIRFGSLLALVVILVGGGLIARSCENNQILNLKRIEACKAIGGYIAPGGSGGTDLCIPPFEGKPDQKTKVEQK